MLLILTAISFNACEKDEAEKQTTPDPTPQLSQTGADVWKNANSNLLHFKNQQVFDSVVEAHVNFTHADFATWENSYGFHSMRAEHEFYCNDTTVASQFEAWVADVFLQSVLNLDGKVVVGDTTYQISEANYYKKFVNGSEVFSQANAIITTSDSATEEESSVIIRDHELKYIWERSGDTGGSGPTLGTQGTQQMSSSPYQNCCSSMPANSPWIWWNEPNSGLENQGEEVVKKFSIGKRKRIRGKIYNYHFSGFYQRTGMKIKHQKKTWYGVWRKTGSAPFMAMWYNGWVKVLQFGDPCTGIWDKYQYVTSDWNKSGIWLYFPCTTGKHVATNGWFMFEYNGDNQNWTDFHARAGKW